MSRSPGHVATRKRVGCGGRANASDGVDHDIWGPLVAHVRPMMDAGATEQPHIRSAYDGMTLLPHALTRRQRPRPLDDGARSSGRHAVAAGAHGLASGRPPRRRACRRPRCGCRGQAFALSTISSYEFSALADASSGPRWFQLHPSVFGADLAGTRPRLIAEIARRPGWALNFVIGRRRASDQGMSRRVTLADTAIALTRTASPVTLDDIMTMPSVGGAIALAVRSWTLGRTERDPAHRPWSSWVNDTLCAARRLRLGTSRASPHDVPGGCQVGRTARARATGAISTTPAEMSWPSPMSSPVGPPSGSIAEVAREDWRGGVLHRNGSTPHHRRRGDPPHRRSAPGT